MTPVAEEQATSARSLLPAAIPFFVFAAVFLALWLLYGNRLILATNDEGIYLDAAERILHGQRLYVDFFGYMSPGSFWMQALAFRLFGVTLAAGHVLVIGYLALECALVYWIVARFASRAAAVVTTLLFLAFETADPSMLTAQHRWDSGAFALASIALCLTMEKLRSLECERGTQECVRQEPVSHWFRGVAHASACAKACLVAAGALIGCAALATPSIALVAMVTLVWLRRRAVWYALGLVFVGGAAGIGLWANGSLAAFIAQLGWLARNYAALNVMPYGSIIGGYAPLFRDASVWELPVRFCVVVCLGLPAILPVIAVAGGAVFYLRHRIPELAYLALCVVALVASTHPRSDIAHLSYIAALPYVVSGILAYRWLAPRPRAWLAALIGVWAAVFVWQGQVRANTRSIQTPVGDVRADAVEAPQITALLAHVHPHQTLFVYPYKPLLYFLTQAQNPTRYSYLAPGMMTTQDADIALSELQAHPPEWVLYMALDRNEFERVFPAAKGFDPHFPGLENWIQKNYRASEDVPLGGYFLLHRF